MDARAQLLTFLRSGDLFDAAEADGDRELIQAFQDGLECWTATQLFPSSSERVFVGEYKAGSPQFRSIRSDQSFSSSVGGSRLAPIAFQTVLVPTIDNSVQIRQRGGTKSVELIIRLQPEAASSQLASLPGTPELDIYCEAKSLAVLKAFLTLSQARWPQQLCLPSSSSEETWPRGGLRKVHAPSDDSLAAGTMSLLNLVRHPGDERFLRLPLRELHAGRVTGDGICEYRVTVQVGTLAAELASVLRDNLWVNRVPMWNRYVGQIDGRGEATTDAKRREVQAFIPRGTPLFILECSDRGTRNFWLDQRCGRWLDPVRTFRLKSEKTGQLKLSFTGDPPAEARIVFLAEEVCGQASEIVGATFEHDSTPLSLLQEIADDREGDLSISWWLTRGYVFPPLSRAMTRGQLVQAAKDLMPSPIQELDPEIQITTTIRATPMGEKSNPLAQHAFPVTVITLSTRGKGALEELSFYGEWLARKLNTMCPLGTVVEVEITR